MDSSLRPPRLASARLGWDDKGMTRGNIYLSYVFFALGLLAKEPAVFLPFIFVLLDLTYFKKKFEDFFTKKEFLSYAVFPGIFAVYMAARFWVLGGLGAGLFYSVNNFQLVPLLFIKTAFYQKQLQNLPEVAGNAKTAQSDH